MYVLWLRGLLRRRGGSLAGVAVVVAAAVALLASLGAFFASSEATMTARSISRVAVDWQVEVQPGAGSGSVLETVKHHPNVRTALPVDFGRTTGLSTTTQGSVQTTAAGVVVGLPDGYARAFPGQIRALVGSPDGVLLTQQTAANLHAAPGDTVTVGRAGLAPASVQVGGVVELPQADTLFQQVGAPAGSQPSAPPDNVVLLPASMWHQIFDPVATARPDQVHEQVHVSIAHDLPARPADAYGQVLDEARNLEAALSGAGRVGNNLGAALGAARNDALYAEMLFLFLGLPGAAVAGLVTAAVARAGADRRRRDQALLRTRGASLSKLLWLGVVEAAAAGIAGTVLGLAAALLIGRVSFGSSSFGAGTGAALLDLALAAGAGLLIAGLAVAIPAWRDARRLSTVAAARRVRRLGGPSPLFLAGGVGLLLVAVLVDVGAQRSGYELVLAPEGVPSVSVNYLALLGPASLWIGAALIVWWLADALLAGGRGALTRLTRPVAGPLSQAVGASLSRQHRLLSRGILLVALASAFAVSTSVFDTTYARQIEVDTRLTNGGDVTVTEPPTAAVPPGFANRLAALPGVRGVEPIQHRYAYVGADLQDLYGVRPSTVVAATQLQDGYFSGGSASQLIGRLAAEPDAILLSAETVKDFQLQLGDRMTLRLRAADASLVPVSFRFAGVVKEFPTAPKDSFLVAKADYVARATGSDAVGSFLIDTGGGSPSAVAARVRTLVGGTATVVDISSTRRVVGSSLTAVDLGGLTRLELGFAAVLAAAGGGMVLALALAQRWHSFAVLIALGARGRQLAAFVASEATLVVLGGMAAGALLGVALAEVLVTVLAGIFDPPPASLTAPWGYLAGVAAVFLVAAGGAVTLTLRSSGSSLIERLRRP
ncbi:MAG: ABC transporter permease [Candidatus Nephthysia bennettiae]|uniref:ABC transporter permease n=1 Tax=Candidatus Nephthysia bennettiae TaxID=3127016 RepID=A0A934JZC6_9BACT|nr:ABC transporter permease [Candidatus Dormibacteraeota bacterium]MBJ7611903.1 ABC transporter permease [Candidatus Dormibacteraeota bacterium]PZR97929.1 MAG: ABC transporter permease [Candidatus Dormibacteraeota bacterium]